MLDHEAWLLGQLDSPDAHSASRPASAAVLQQVNQLRATRQAIRNRSDNQPVPADQNAIRDFGRYISSQYQQQASDSLHRAITAPRPFHERLVRFWANHFAVSADKQPIGAIAGLYRDEAIRPRITGNFRDLLKAAIRHPAMLLYLDNVQSIGPGSTLGSRANGNRRAGLNENLAREILELHTLGVDGGYTQDDVIEFSKSLTGWSVGGTGPADRIGGAARRFARNRDPEAPGEFTFRSAVHEPGAKTILGRRFSEGGADEAESVLDFLAGQPQTARFIARKLARHFVADDPPAAVVERLTAVYLDSDAELMPVYRELVRAPESWAMPLAKYKTPEEFLISMFRAIGLPPDDTRLVGMATELGQRPFTPQSPAGWPDVADHWNSGQALLERIEFATAIGARIGDRVAGAARLDEVLGEVAGDATRLGIRRAESGAQAVALLLAAPEFQRR